MAGRLIPVPAFSREARALPRAAGRPLCAPVAPRAAAARAWRPAVAAHAPRSTAAAMPPQAPPPALSRADRARLLGLDAPEALYFRGWAVGKESRLRLSLQNVRTDGKTVDITYTAPHSHLFGINFPEAIRLRPGCSASIDVTFAPVASRREESWMDFSTGEAGGFRLPLLALEPLSALEAPPVQDFSYCGVAETLSRPFPLRNAGDTPVNFAWTCPPPYSLQPPSGTLAPGEIATITATFAPGRAAVADVVAVCAVAAGVPPLRVALRGVGKLPHVRPSAPVVDFGVVPVGRTAEQALPLLNATAAAAAFTLRRADEAPGAHDAVFSAAPAASRLAGFASVAARLEFVPSVPGLTSLERFVVATPGGAPATLTLRGTAAGPAVTISATSLSYGFVDLAELAATSAGPPTKYLQLDNASDLPVPFELADAGGAGWGAFQAEPRAGTIPPRGFVQVGVAFVPAAAANYHRRLTVLLEHAPPLGVDCTGAGFTAKARPPALPPGVLAAHRGAGGAPAQPPPPGAPPRDVALEFLRGDPACGIGLDATSLDFGACGAMRPPEVRVVTLENRTAKTLDVTWHPAAAADGGVAGSQPAFVVLPEAKEVEAGGVAVFRVSFRPTKARSAYEGALEVHARVRSQRSWRLPAGEDGAALAPPWSATLRCVGHTHAPPPAQPPGPPPPAALALSVDRRVAFTPVPPGGAAYRTVALRLAPGADGPVAWGLAELPEGCPFAVRPACGVLHPGGAALLACAFLPPPGADVAASAPLRFTLNGHPAPPSLEAELLGTAASPAAAFDLPRGGPLRLRPTCVGGASARRVRVLNPTALPLEAEWVVPPALAGVLAPLPARFALPGRDAVEVTWTFAPCEAGDFEAAVPLTLRHVTAGGVTASGTAALRLAARVAPCALRLEPRCLEGSVLPPGGTAQLTATLHNDSDGAVDYAWLPSDPPGALLPAAPGGTLAPHEARPVALTLACAAPGALLARLPLTVGAAGRAASASPASAASSATLVLEAACTGAAPTLRVVDAAVAGLPPCVTWQHLGVDALNAALAALATSSSASAAPTAVELPLGVAAPGAPPSTAHLWLRNDGCVDAPFALRLAHETDGVTPERWVRSAAPEDADAADALALGLFDVAPRAGTLPPGGTVRLCFAYAHDAPGAHAATAQLRLGAGASPPLELRLCGRTLRGSAAPALHGPGVALAAGGAAARTLSARLAPQPLGLAQPPAQCVTLRSAAAVDVQYVLDTAALDAAAAVAYGFPVLSCANPTGWLPARGAAALHFAFRPLEAGPLRVALPLLLIAVPAAAAAGTAPSVAASVTASVASGAAAAQAAPPAGAEDAAAVVPADGAGAEMAVLELEAEGFNPLTVASPPVPALLVPSGRALGVAGEAAPPPLPGQLAAATPAALRLGVLSPGGEATSRVTLAPAAGGAPPLRFRWELDEGALPGGATLTVVPQAGRLPPGGVACAVTLRAGHAPALVATALRCVFEPVRAPPRSAKPTPTIKEHPEEEIFAQHGIHLGQPLVRPPRQRTSVLRAATISSALKFPAAMREMLPAAAPPAARLAAQPEAALPADVAGVVLVGVTAVIESEEALADRAAAARLGATSASDPYGDADEWADDAWDEDEQPAAAEVAPADAADAAAEVEQEEDAFDADDEPLGADDVAGGGMARPSTSSTLAVEGAVDDLLAEDFEADDVAEPEEADQAAIEAGAAFLDVLEAMLDAEEGGAADAPEAAAGEAAA